MFSPLTRVATRRVYTLLPAAISLLIIHGHNVMSVGDSTVIHGGSSRVNRTSSMSRKLNNKTILYWTRMYGSEAFNFGEGNIFEKCTISSCVATSNRSFQPVEKFDAVMFHGIEVQLRDLPKNRSDHQRYIFVDMESPDTRELDNHFVFRTLFNWTMTYRRDSDIMLPYGFIHHGFLSNGSVSDRTLRLISGKTRMAAWFVSHCSTPSKREQLVTKLQEHMTIDVYGSCGKLKCSQTAGNDCMRMVERNYFFYMSFENTLCRDYLTEKVYKALKVNVVPVVYGSADYASVLPPNSYVNAMEFRTAMELAEFLTNLANDRFRYLSYFKWKNLYKVDISNRYTICKLCAALHDDRMPRKTVEDIHSWWTEGSYCREGRTFS